jgi:signal peptide peptidase SppA
MNTYLHIARALFTQTWAIRREEWDVLAGILSDRISHGPLSSVEIEERTSAARERRAARPAAPVGVAVIPMHGTIIPKASLLAESSGATSVEAMRSQLGQALEDPDVGAVVLDIDSPGGIVSLVPEFARELRAARAQKPIVAVANPFAASAAFWLGAQADEFMVTPSGEVGSVGVFNFHQDWSAFWEKEGVKTTLVSAGKFKVEGNEFEPLSDDARADMQKSVDHFMAMFVNDLAAGRGTTAKLVRDTFGEGRMVFPKDALDKGMVDRVGTLEDGIVRAAQLSHGRQVSGAAAFHMKQPAEAWQELESSSSSEPEPTPDPEPTPEPVPSADWYALRARRRARLIPAGKA